METDCLKWGLERDVTNVEVTGELIDALIAEAKESAARDGYETIEVLRTYVVPKTLVNSATRQSVRSEFLRVVLSVRKGPT